MYFRRYRRAVDENLAFRVPQQAIPSGRENLFHGRVIRDDRDDHVRQITNASERARGFGAQFLGDSLSRFFPSVINYRYLKTLFLQSAGHIGSHSAYADETYFF